MMNYRLEVQVMYVVLKYREIRSAELLSFETKQQPLEAEIIIAHKVLNTWHRPTCFSFLNCLKAHYVVLHKL